MVIKRNIEAMEQPKNIVIRMPNWLGDLVMATPILADIRKRWPSAKITAMCQSNVAALLTHDPHIDKVFSFRKPKGWLDRENCKNLITSLKSEEFDLGILLTHSFSSAWWFFRGNVKHRIGFSGNLRSLLLNPSVPVPEDHESRHLVQTYKSLLEPLGMPISDTPPALYIDKTEKSDAVARLATHGIDLSKHIIVGINPGAAYGSAKCWLPERFKEVTQRLLERENTYIVYFGDPAGAPLVTGICEGFGERVINLAAKTSLRELMALIDCCTIILTNDSGPMHISAALGKPLVALFGSTSDVKTGPYLHGKVIHKHVECSPCYRRTCPIDFRCMKRIEVDEVVNELIGLIYKPINI